MLAEALLLASVQFGPLFQQKSDFMAVRPLVARESETTDVLWPVFTSHRDWWRFCLLVHYQDYLNDGYQFEIMPFWFQGRSKEGSYCGLFPLAGYHPHIALVYNLKFALWPLWTQYEMPRGRDWMKTNAILFPFVSWRDDGSWSVWPLYGVNHQRESDHRYVLWPFVTWASYREDRDTAGAGFSWMVWPLYGCVCRDFEDQHLWLPPFFSFAATYHRHPGQDVADLASVRIRFPWPFFEFEATPSRERLSVWPFWERSRNLAYKDGAETARVTRFGWKLVELYDHETRVFPFYVHSESPETDTSYTRIWPLWESTTTKGWTTSRALALMPIRWVPQLDRNWAKFWTFYESESCPLGTDHSLLWGLIQWRTEK